MLANWSPQISPICKKVLIKVLIDLLYIYRPRTSLDVKVCEKHQKQLSYIVLCVSDHNICQDNQHCHLSHICVAQSSTQPPIWL